MAQVIHFPLNSSRNEASRLGAARAQSDFSILRDQVRPEADVIQMVLIDFDGIEHSNTSYIRNGPFWFFACGRLHASGGVAAKADFIDPWRVQPLPVIPAVANLCPEVREAIDEVFFVRGAPCLEVVEFNDTGIQKAKLLGSLEPKLMQSLIQFCSFGKDATAAQLHAQFSADHNVGVTAWNNRLSELHELLLVTRQKQGKFWHYQPVTKEIQDGRGSRT